MRALFSSYKSIIVISALIYCISSNIKIFLAIKNSKYFPCYKSFAEELEMNTSKIIIFQTEFILNKWLNSENSVQNVCI